MKKKGPSLCKTCGCSHRVYSKYLTVKRCLNRWGGRVIPRPGILADGYVVKSHRNNFTTYFKADYKNCPGHKQTDTQCRYCDRWFANIRRHKCRGGRCGACEGHFGDLHLHMARMHKTYGPLTETSIFPDSISAIVSGYVADIERADLVKMCLACGKKVGAQCSQHCINDVGFVKIGEPEREEYMKKIQAKMREFHSCLNLFKTY